MTATDNFTPTDKRTSVTVTVVVTRDSFTQFTSVNPLRLFVSERRPVNYTITSASNRITASDSDLTVIVGFFFYNFNDLSLILG